jgi:predicted nuclease of restriction endonuclease-like (RecB) superfamily
MSGEQDRHELIDTLHNLLLESRRTAMTAVNAEMLRAYWEMGKILAEWEREHGLSPESLETIATSLVSEFGKAFTPRKLAAIREFYREYEHRLPLIRFKEKNELAESGMRPLNPRLSWSHYRIIMKLPGRNARYEAERRASRGGWSVAELERNLSAAGSLPRGSDQFRVEEEATPAAEDFAKDPHVQAFLGIPERQRLAESILERLLIDHLQKFLLEQGKELFLVDRQKEFEFKGKKAYVDLVFYSRPLRAFLLAELVYGEFTTDDEERVSHFLGQMMDDGENTEENPPAAILLSVSRAGGRMKYMFSEKGDEKQYRAYLPLEEDLALEIQKEREDILRKYPVIVEDA